MTLTAVVAFSLVVFGGALLAMSVGVLFGREPIRGSCGGVAGRCAACTRPCRKRRAEAASPAEESP